MAQVDCPVLLVANPVSGNGKSSRLIDSILRGGPAVAALSAAVEGGDPRDWPIVRTTADGGWRAEVEASIKTRGTRVLVVIGGDGTLMAAAALLHRLVQEDKEFSKRLSMVPVPGGRGNDFVRAFYGYTEKDGPFWEWAERRISSQRIRWASQSLDLGSSNGHLFLNMASLGFGGRVVENAQGRNAFWSKTPLVYQVEGLLEMVGGGEVWCDVKVDGASVYAGKFFGGFVGNGAANGAGLYWTREARLDDGMLNAIVFPKPGVVEMMRTMKAVKSVSVSAPPLPLRHKLMSGSEIVLYFDRPTALELDGDYINSAMSHGFKCLPQALNSWVIKK